MAKAIRTGLALKTFWGCALMGYSQDYQFNDSHFHLTNYIQKGITLDQMLEIMGDRVGRVALFGIPLQQTWAFQNSGDYDPQYYLQTDAPLYYYSFTDAHIASIYNQLTDEQKQRFDPMITGFNPADMYAVDHIHRVLETFPGVFSGIGEFTVHKEFVSSKVAGNVASLTNPAMDSILTFTAETGLVSIIHCDIDIPFQKTGKKPVYLRQMLELLARHPDATVIWAHTGLGRVVHPVTSNNSDNFFERSPAHLELLAEILADSRFNHLHFDISWDEVAKYVVSSPENIEKTANLLNTYNTRFLFGTDNVAPESKDQYFAVFDMYDPLWEKLTPETKENVLLKNYERLFDAASAKVRKWEAANLKK
ncbi:amidohydrolase family protein [Pontibacter sp. G13]|uniref:amidohydrolase family protein n=1 Tax=Pontibacter sp. G13 TaxID=3074898 RepID=UPI00288C6072|nr:amidohydrolase family protein [Pontibacter sp. G13]WNJ18186.1 amidohydrolase family protein [Pontibacter sp. G13]